MTSSILPMGGIFTSERGQRFLQILAAFGERGFKGLYDKCKEDVDGDYYQQGLKRVKSWSDAVIREDVDFVCEFFPDSYDTYSICFTNYVYDLNPKRKADPIVPSLTQFVRFFLGHLGCHESLETGDFFMKRDQSVKYMACADAARMSLYDLSKEEEEREGPPVVDLASEVSVHKLQREMDLASEIRPQDSISQVDFYGSRRETSEDRDTPLPLPPPPKGKKGSLRREDRSEAGRSAASYREAPPPRSEAGRSARESTYGEDDGKFSRREDPVLEREPSRMPPSKIPLPPPSRQSKPVHHDSRLDPPQMIVRTDIESSSVVSRHDFEEKEDIVMVENESIRPKEKSNVGIGIKKHTRSPR